MIIALLFTLAFAVYCAQDDARQISRGVTIKHAGQWIVRAVVMVGFIVCAYVLLRPTLVDSLVMLIGCGALFSATFRLVLNTMRGKPWWYMGSVIDDRIEGASTYDAWWHWIAWKVSGGKYDAGCYRMYPSRLPAKLAYLVEMIIATAFTVWAW